MKAKAIVIGHCNDQFNIIVAINGEKLYITRPEFFTEETIIPEKSISIYGWEEIKAIRDLLTAFLDGDSAKST